MQAFYQNVTNNQWMLALKMRTGDHEVKPEHSWDKQL